MKPISPLFYRLRTPHATTAFATAILCSTISSLAYAAPPPDPAQQALGRLSDICRDAKAVSYKAAIDVTIRPLPNGPVQHDCYTVLGTFQHEVFARIDEVQNGKTVLMISSNPEYMHVYSPVTNRFRNFGNVPVYFAVWDMLMAQGANSDVLAPASRYLGYYYDITGYFGGTYGGDSPWDADHTRTDMGKYALADAVVKGKRVKRLRSAIHGANGITTWDILLDAQTGLPLRATMTAKGDSLGGPAGQKAEIKLDETYDFFKPSQTPQPESAFKFIPPSDAIQVKD